MKNDENLKILDLLLDTMEQKSNEDISSFRAEVEVEYGADSYETGFDDDDSKGEMFPRQHKTFQINWHPREYSWHSATITAVTTGECVSIVYYAGDPTVSIIIDHYHSIEIELGSGSSNKEIKKKFIKLFRKLEKFTNEEIPRRRHEEFIDSLTKTFPNILDELILEDQNEEN